MEPIADIKETREGLRDWLRAYRKQDGVSEEQFRDVAVQLAHRSAMRVLPIWLNISRRFDLTNHRILRSLLISGIIRKHPAPELRTAAAAYAAAAYAAAAADADVYAADAYAAYAAYAAAAAAYAAYAAYAADAAAAAYAAAAAADASRPAIWNETKTDLQALVDGQDLFTTPLWNAPEQEVKPTGSIISSIGALLRNPQDQGAKLIQLWQTEKAHLTDPRWGFGLTGIISAWRVPTKTAIGRCIKKLPWG